MLPSSSFIILELSSQYCLSSPTLPGLSSQKSSKLIFKWLATISTKSLIDDVVLGPTLYVSPGLHSLQLNILHLLNLAYENKTF